MSKIIYSAIQYGLLTINEHSRERVFPIRTCREQPNIYHVAPPALLVATRSFFTSSAVVYFCQDFFVCVPVAVMSSVGEDENPAAFDSLSFSEECFCVRYSRQCPVTFFFFNNPETTQYCSKLHLVLIDDLNVHHRNPSSSASLELLLPPTFSSSQESLRRFAFLDTLFKYSSFYMQQIKITFLFRPLKERHQDSGTGPVFAQAFMNDSKNISFSSNEKTPFQGDEFSKADGTVLNAILFKHMTENNNESSNMSSRFLNLTSLSLVEFSTYTFDVLLALHHHHHSQENSRNENPIHNYSIRNLTFNLRCRNDHMFLICDYLFPPYQKDDDDDDVERSSFSDLCDFETDLGMSLHHLTMVSCARGDFFTSDDNAVPREAFKFEKTNSFANFIKFMTNGARSLEALTIESSSVTVQDDCPIIITTNSANRRNEFEVGFVETSEEANGFNNNNKRKIFSLHHMLIDSLYLSNPQTSSYSSRRLKKLDLSRLRLTPTENRFPRERDAREFNHVLEIVQKESRELRGVSSANNAPIFPDEEDKIALLNRVLLSQEFFHDLIYEACPQLEVLKMRPEINGWMWNGRTSKDPSFVANMSGSDRFQGSPLSENPQSQQQPTATAMLLQSLHRIVLRDLVSFKICVTSFMKGIRNLSITCPLTRSDIIVMGMNLSVMETFKWEQDAVGFSLMAREFFANGGRGGDDDNHNIGGNRFEEEAFFDLDFSPPTVVAGTWFANLSKLVLSSVAGPSSSNLSANRMQLVGNKNLLHLMASLKKMKNISLSEFVYENNPMKRGSFDDEIAGFPQSKPPSIKKIVTLQLEHVFVPVKRLDSFFSEIFSLGQFGLKNLFTSLILTIPDSEDSSKNNNDNAKNKFPSLAQVCSTMIANYSYTFDDESRPRFDQFHFVCATSGATESRNGYHVSSRILITKDGNEFPLLQNNKNNEGESNKDVDPVNCKPLFRDGMDFFEIGCVFNGMFCHGRK